MDALAGRCTSLIAWLQSQKRLTMLPSPTSPRRQKIKSNLQVLVVGIFIGFLASSFLSMASYEDVVLNSSSDNNYRSLPLTPQSKVFNHSLTSTKKGWKTIHVFYGNESHLVDNSEIPNDYYHQNKWFSQVKQDFLVSKLFRGKRNGYFIDLAANDAVRISNTYALETFFGWRGLCIEPNPHYWASLSYRKCDIVAAVIGHDNMAQVQFKFPNRAPPKGGIVGPAFDNKEPSKYGEDRPRFTVRLSDVFDLFNVPKVIDYLSLDVEGAEEFVMEDFPFDRYRINILTVERPSPSLCKLLESNGYTMLKQLKKWGETLWAHRLVEDSLDKTALEMETQTYFYSQQKKD